MTAYRVALGPSQAGMMKSIRTASYCGPPLSRPSRAAFIWEGQGGSKGVRER
jgi:hypothetical protein